MKHPYKVEVIDLLMQLQENGFELYSVNDGEENILTLNDVKRTADVILSVDESWLNVKYGVMPANRSTIFIVLGNCPGEAWCDNTIPRDDEMREKLDYVADEHYNKWSTT